MDKLINGSGNVVIIACAGSGKTTTIHQIAVAGTGKKTLLGLMFNRRIMEETISRAKNLGIENMIVYTYHSFACEFYSSECFTDQGLKRVLKYDMQPQKELPQFDILVLDEQQDMNPILYEFIRKVVRDAKKDSGPQILFLGDPNQEIYPFNNADKRFLSMAKELFQDLCVGVRADWTVIRQRISYRMSKQIVKFINQQVLKPPEGEEILTVETHENPRPRYLICDSLSDYPLNEIFRLIDLGLLPSQIIVLAHSLRSKKRHHVHAHVQYLANKLALLRPEIPVHISTGDDVEISPRVTQGKLIFATYHQAKGIEREAAIVFDFDMSYYDWENLPNPQSADSPQSVDSPQSADSSQSVDGPRSADNPQYVAVTRARTHLVVIHDYRYKYLPFIDQKKLHESCEVVQLRDIAVPQGKRKLNKPSTRYTHVTSLTRNQSERVVSDCFAMLELGQVEGPKFRRAWPVAEIEVREDVWEFVADITGTAIPAIYEFLEEKTCSSFSSIFRKRRNKQDWVLEFLPPEHIQRLRSLEQETKTGRLDIADILYLANVTNAIKSGYIVKVLSIPFEKYAWFKPAHAKTVSFNLRKHMRKPTSYEKETSHLFKDVLVKGDRVSLCGQTDFSAYGFVIEAKGTRILKPEHVLQLALYSAISMAKLSDAQNKAIKFSKRYLLINVPTSQVVTIEVKPRLRDELKKVLQMLLAKPKETTLQSLNDMEFRDEAAGGFQTFISRVTVPAWLSHVSKKPVS